MDGVWLQYHNFGFWYATAVGESADGQGSISFLSSLDPRQRLQGIFACQCLDNVFLITMRRDVENENVWTQRAMCHCATNHWPNPSILGLTIGFPTLLLGILLLAIWWRNHPQEWKGQMLTQTTHDDWLPYLGPSTTLEEFYSCDTHSIIFLQFSDGWEYMNLTHWH